MKKMTALFLALVMLMGIGIQAAMADVEPALVRLFFSDAIKPDCKKVEDAMNEYTIPNLGVKVELVFFSSGEFYDKLPLMIASDEQMDIVFDSLNIAYVSRARAGAYLDITDMLADYPDLYNAVDPLLWEGAKLNGRIYGVPTNKEAAESWAFYAETEFMEQNGIDPASIKTFEDGEKILEALIKDSTRAPFMITSQNGHVIFSAGLLDVFDIVDNDAIGVRRDNPAVIVNTYDSDEFEALVRTMHDWFEKGYIFEDAITRDNYDEYKKDGTGYGLSLASITPLHEVGQSNAYGKSLTYMPITPTTISNNSCLGSMNCVLSKSKNPEAALKFLQAWNTDPYIKNLMTYGIEGVHYNLVDGKAQPVENVRDLYVNANWKTGNIMISYLQVGEPDNKYDLYREFNESAVASNVLGFQPDTQTINDKMAAIEGVVAEYRPLLLCGAVDPDEYLPMFREALKDIGIDEVVAYYQAQLDDWRAATGR